MERKAGQMEKLSWNIVLLKRVLVRVGNGIGVGQIIEKNIKTYSQIRVRSIDPSVHWSNTRTAWTWLAVADLKNFSQATFGPQLWSVANPDRQVPQLCGAAGYFYGSMMDQLGFDGHWMGGTVHVLVSLHKGPSFPIPNFTLLLFFFAVESARWIL